MTDTEMVLRHLQYRGPLTALESVRLYGVLRLAPRIWDLRQAGYPIVSETVKTPNGKRIASYRLIQEPVQIAAGL